MEEVATLLNLTEEQVYHAHANAIKKLRAALTSFGYHKEVNR
jgi:DNA-directed RNA polymerase specialized sigma subunit